MIKTKFTLERGIIGCILSFFILSIVITGCGKDYDYDIDRLTKKINAHDSMLNALQTQITAIQNNIANARWITSVEPTTTGYMIYFNAGNPNPIAINHGTPGTVWRIGPGTPDQDGGRTYTYRDSLWYKCEAGRGDCVETEYVAIPPRGRDGVDGVPGSSIPVLPPRIVDGYWVTYEWNPAINNFDSTRYTDYPIVGDLVAYVTDDPNNAGQWLLNVKRGQLGDTYEAIPLPKSAAALPEAAEGNITLIGHIASPNASTLSLSAIDTSALVVKYWYPDSIYNVTQSVKLETWQGQKQVRPKQLLSTLSRELSLVLTSDVSLSGAFKLKNSRGEALPLVMTSVPYTGLLTKAGNVSGGSVYLASLSTVDSTYATTAEVTSGFTNKFAANAVYYLENGAGIKSNYSPFTIRTEDHSSDAVTVANVARLVAANGNIIPVSGGAANVAINTAYTIGFDSNATYLCDYNIDDNNHADVEVYLNFGSFMAMQSGISCQLVVRKLLVDGKIHEETITVTTN